MWEKVAKCDVCGRVKGEGNKWLLAALYTIAPDRGGLDVECFAIYHWNDLLAQDMVRHATTHATYFLCGEQCLHKRLNEFLALRGTITPTEAPCPKPQL